MEKPVFQFRGGKIPSTAPCRSVDWRRERLESLASVPNHKSPRSKFSGDSSQCLSFTMEDQGLIKNLPLVSTLRTPISIKEHVDGGNPPRFYEDDQDKWRKKFAGALKERQQAKRKFYEGRVANILNTNDNVDEHSPLNNADAKLKAVKYTGG